MEVEKLEQEVKTILGRADGPRNYAEIRQELQQKGYSQEELKFMMALVDERLLSSLKKGGQSKTSKRNMILGAALSLAGLMLVVARYLGQPIAKEVTYIALVVFAIGYLVFRHGFRNRKEEI